jgi:hypothetical protein
MLAGDAAFHAGRHAEAVGSSSRPVAALPATDPNCRIVTDDIARVFELASSPAEGVLR